jgi:hypothetical protein
VSRRSLQRLTLTGGRHDRQLPDAFGFTDADGTKPDCWGDLAAHGWERDDAGVSDFRSPRHPTGW